MVRLDYHGIFGWLVIYLLILSYLCDPMSQAYQLPLSVGFSRILEWVAISSSMGSSWPWDWTQVSCTSYIAVDSLLLSHQFYYNHFKEFQRTVAGWQRDNPKSLSISRFPVIYFVFPMFEVMDLSFNDLLYHLSSHFTWNLREHISNNFILF